MPGVTSQISGTRHKQACGRSQFKFWLIKITYFFRPGVFGEFDKFSAISSSCQLMFTQLWRMASNRTTKQGEFNGRRHGQMSRDGTRYPDRHRYRPQELQRHPGLLRARLLPDLSDRA